MRSSKNQIKYKNRYFKVLNKFDVALEIGQYLLITSEPSAGTVNTVERDVIDLRRLDADIADLELMPEGFNPNNKIINTYSIY